MKNKRLEKKLKKKLENESKVKRVRQIVLLWIATIQFKKRNTAKLAFEKKV